MKAIKRIFTTALLSALPLAAVQADVVRIPLGQQADEQQAQQPTRGMTKDSVRERFGEPDEQRGPVGEPPISHWDYGDYVVYFEGNRVLHSVVKHERRDD